MPIHGFPGNVISATPPSVTVNGASGVFTTEQQMQYQAAGNWPMPLTQISRSLRFNSADSAYLNRTPASAGNRKTWTFSCWVKRSAIAQNVLFSAPDGAGYFRIELDDLHKISVIAFNNSISNICWYYTNNLLRDPSAWYHIVVAVDTTQATDTNRVKIYINGVSASVVQSTAITQNTDTVINSTVEHAIGRSANYGPYYLSAYLAETYLIDGQALTPASFGQTNSNTGIWEPRQYTGPYGTNGFYLNFSDNSGTTSTTLGKDYSGNGNNWTPNNFSVTAGAGNDSLVDTPTPYGTDTGAGGEVRGNYCLWNPLSTSRTLTNGNLYTEVNGGGGSNVPISATMAIPTTGKWYWEITAGGSAGGGNGGWDWGIVNITVPNFRLNNLIIAGTGGCYGVNGNDGNFRENNTTGISGYISGGITNGDVAQVAYDADNGKLWLGKNNTWGNDGSGNGDPAAGLRPAKTAAGGMTGQFIPVFEYASDSGVVSATANFGQRPFAYTAPSGFKALCTQNLPTPTIGATSTTQAGKYFNPVLYTGAQTTTQAITGVGFTPDWTWIKRRSQAARNVLTDVVRGTGKSLYSDSTDAEVTNDQYGYLTSFDSDGFTVNRGSGNLGERVNDLNATYVAWNWKANGAGSSNTQGTITSTVSANTTAGFSIVTYTGTGVAATVGHGLGVAPNMVIVKRRNAAVEWPVYHVSVGNNKYLYLNTTAAAATFAMWNNTTPTSTVFSIGVASDNNANTGTYVAYCFAAVEGYSAFGSYTGNGSTDGPFVYTGFRPAFVLMKVTSTTDSWVIVDRTRSPYNVAKLTLFPNLSNAENDGSIEVDMLSNGFKLRTANSNVNASQTFIYAAFAENPFKYALAR